MVNAKRHNRRTLSLRGFMDVSDSNILLCESNEILNYLDIQASRKPEHVFAVSGRNCAAVSVQETVGRPVVKDNLLTKYGDKNCGQICTKNASERSNAFPPHPRNVDDIALISDQPNIAEVMDSSALIPDSVGLEGDVEADTDSTRPATGEVFSGTIMINNQSIIVAIENGVLTVAAPQDGLVRKEDDVVSFKEHLCIKDQDDVVLLNYDSGTKSFGKISTLTVSRSRHQEEPKTSLCVSDSELTLVTDCALSELGNSLDSTPLTKQESRDLAAVTEPDLISLSPRVAVLNCNNEDLRCVPPVRAKKEAVTSFCCREPGCSSTFTSRQKLKVHLLNHAEDPRPHQCPYEGCGWAFPTSYKLKRHLLSHDKNRPHICQFEGCGRRFTTVYNLKAHVKVHEHDDSFICEICSEKFRSSARLGYHQRVHFEPQRPHKCEFPGCEKTFMTFSALFSHNRTHFRESGRVTCTFPGCNKTYDKACRLKLHFRSHTGERPFVCDSQGCAWSFTSMSKLLRHKRKHEDNRRFVCTEEGCGKSFTRAEHLKGHSITHLGTKPFQCLAEGCNARFSARSSLYIHSRKHKQDISTLKTRCPVADCTKHFSSRSSLKSHMLKHHNLSHDVLNQLVTMPTLTPSSELNSSTSTIVSGPGVADSDQLTNLDLTSLFNVMSAGAQPTTGIGVGIPLGGANANGTFAMDLSLVSSGILTIDPSSVGTTLCTNGGTTLTKSADPLILASSADISPHHSLEGVVSHLLPHQGTLNLDDVQTVSHEALGTLNALTMQGAGAPLDTGQQHSLSSCTTLTPEATHSMAVAPVTELLGSPPAGVEVSGQGGTGPLLGCVEVLGPPGGGKVLTHFVFPTQNTVMSQKESEPDSMSPSGLLESGGSARTDYRAIQLAKKKKNQKSPTPSSGGSRKALEKSKGAKASTVPTAGALPSHYGDAALTTNSGLTLRDPVIGAQFVQIQLLQDDPATDGELAFQLNSPPTSSHSQLTCDLPANILQEPSAMTEEDKCSTNPGFTGSTINLQDLE